MKKSLLSNIPLKLMSVVIAIVVWLLVVNIDDPIIAKTIPGVTVSIENESYVESGGKMCLVEENQDVISVQVTGKRSVVDKINADNITATADLKQIVDMSTTPIMVPISVSCPGIQPANITAVPRNMSISLDDKMTLEFIITASSDNLQPVRGYELGEVTVMPEKVEITGPQSLMKKIDRVVATVTEETEISEDTTLTAGLTIIDKNQDTLEERQMDYLKYLNLDSPSVQMNVDLWKVRNDIKIQGNYVGYPADGYKVEKISFTPDVVSVAGSDEGLQQLTQLANTITIPDECIDVSGQQEDFEVRLSIEDFLPEGIELITGSSDTVIATVSILSQDSREYSIPTTNIQALNVGRGLQAVYETDNIQVRVREGTENLDDLKTADIKASIDFSDRDVGTYNLPVTIAVPDGYEVDGTVTTSVQITETVEADNIN